jgi:Lon protease-like protein
MRRLPLFVLPTVLYPGTMMPLHVFEPRYRRMVAQCLEADRLFGLLFHDFDSQPEFRAREGHIGCTAEITHFKPLPDGRSLLLAHGRERFRVVDGIESDAPFHEALVEDYTDVAPDTGDIEAQRAHTVTLVRRVLHRLQPGNGELPPIEVGEDVSFALAAIIQIDPRWKQMLLELATERARLHQIERVLLPLAGDS